MTSELKDHSSAASTQENFYTNTFFKQQTVKTERQYQAALSRNTKALMDLIEDSEVTK